MARREPVQSDLVGHRSRAEHLKREPGLGRFVMRARRSFLNWGSFLIGLGAIPLAVQLGILDQAAAGEVLRLWPLILITIGVGVLLRFTQFDAVGGVLSGGVAGILLGSLIVGGFTGAAAACNSTTPSGTAAITQSGQFGEGTASLGLEITCGDVHVDRTAGQSWNVEVSSAGQPTIESGATSLTLASPKYTGINPFGSGRREQWRVVMPTEQTLSTSVTLNASTADLELGGGAMSSVNATFNGSDATVDLLGDATQTMSLSTTLNASSMRLNLPLAQTTGNVTVNVASLVMCVPEGAGVHIDYHGTLSSENFAAAGFVQSGDSWQSPNFDYTGVRIALGLTANVSSITVNPAGGCR